MLAGWRAIAWHGFPDRVIITSGVINCWDWSNWPGVTSVPDLDKTLEGRCVDYRCDCMCAWMRVCGTVRCGALQCVRVCVRVRERLCWLQIDANYRTADSKT